MIILVELSDELLKNYKLKITNTLTSKLKLNCKYKYKKEKLKVNKRGSQKNE